MNTAPSCVPALCRDPTLSSDPGSLWRGVGRVTRPILQMEERRLRAGKPPVLVHVGVGRPQPGFRPSLLPMCTGCKGLVVRFFGGVPSSPVLRGAGSLPILSRREGPEAHLFHRLGRGGREGKPGETGLFSTGSSCHTPASGFYRIPWWPLQLCRQLCPFVSPAAAQTEGPQRGCFAFSPGDPVEGEWGGRALASQQQAPSCLPGPASAAVFPRCSPTSSSPPPTWHPGKQGSLWGLVT